MEQLTQTNEAAEKDEFLVLESQIRECFGRVVYSHKTHEKCADLYLTRHSQIKMLQILLSVITTGSLLVTILGQGRVSTIIAAIASAGLLAINSYTKDYDLGQMSQKHKLTASSLWNVRETYFSLLTDLKAGYITYDDAILKRDKLQEDLLIIYEAAPRTVPKAYMMAQRALKVDEDLTFSDAEIDHFLPADLKRKTLEKTAPPAVSGK